MPWERHMFEIISEVRALDIPSAVAASTGPPSVSGPQIECTTARVYRAGKALLPPECKRRAREWAQQPLPRAINNVTQELRLAVETRGSQRRLQGLADAKKLKLHMGCGSDLRSGWANIDMSSPRGGVPPGILFVRHDLRKGLPLPDGTCDLVYSSHLLEHLEYRHGVALLRECHRILAPGGRFRIALPNLRLVFQAYVNDDIQYFDPLPRSEVAHVAPGTEAIVDWVNYSVYQRGEHLTIYDEDKLMRLLKNVGFHSVAVSEYDRSIDSSDPVRIRYSFYIEAVK